MTDVPFHATRMGRTYYEHTLPRLVEELARLNATLVELVEVIERRGSARWPQTDLDRTEEHGAPDAGTVLPS